MVLRPFYTFSDGMKLIRHQQADGTIMVGFNKGDVRVAEVVLPAIKWKFHSVTSKDLMPYMGYIYSNIGRLSAPITAEERDGDDADAAGN